MCGVVGFNQGRTDSDGRDIIQRMLKTVQHRGPDGQHHIVTSSHTYLGHTRLAMRGAEGCNQPIVERHSAIAVNGEIYNELPWEQSDAELAMHLPPGDLIGEFAYAKCSNNDSCTILVRDRFGIKPMFYYWEPGLYVFGSEPQAILAHPKVKVSTSELLECAQFVNMPIPGTTYWKEIRSVLPGGIVVLTLYEPPTNGRYWDLPIDSDWRTVYPEEIYERLGEAVTVRKRDNRCLIYVSAGMDGRIINHLTSDESLTCNFGDGDNFLDATYTLDEFEPNDLVDCAIRACRTIYNPIGVAKERMSAKAKELGYKAVMSGQGADELFAGYQFFNNDAWSGLSEPNEVSHPAFQDIYGFTPQFLTPWLKLWRASIYYPHVDPFAIVAEQLTRVGGNYDKLTTEQYLWIKTHFESQILLWGGDRPEMTNSIEGRVPYLDLVDLAFSIRPEERRNKKPLRDTFDSIIKCPPKRSFMYPYRYSAYNNELLLYPLHGPLADSAYWQYTTFKALQDHKWQ